jgi:hypothetical protein
LTGGHLTGGHLTGGYLAGADLTGGHLDRPRWASLMITTVSRLHVPLNGRDHGEWPH